MKVKLLLLLITALYPATAIILYLAFYFHAPAALNGSASAYVATDAAMVVLPVLFLPVVVKNCVQLTLAVWYGRRRPAADGQVRRPSMSVLIPAWNEEVGIVATIRSVLATGYAPLEIVVIDDGSTDRTDEVVRAFLAGHEGVPIRYRSVPNGGKARALNAALTMARGEIVVTIDADSVMHQDFLDAITRHMDAHGLAAAAGNVMIGNGARPLGLLQKLEYLSGFFFKRAEAMMGAVYIVGGAAAAYRREILDRIGGFDPSIITEDIELSMRFQHHGYRVGYATEAVVYTEGPADLGGLCRQRLRWKHGRLLCFWRYRAMFASRRPEHSRYLGLFVLPAALYGEVLLLAWPILLPVSVAAMLITHDVVLLAIVVALITLVVWMQILLDRRRCELGRLAFLAPIAWLLFCWVDLIECQALLRSLARIATGRTVRWQRWQRQGVFDQGAAEVARLG